MHKTSSYTFQLRGTTDFRSIQKYTPHKNVLGITSHRGPKTSGRNSEKNVNKRKDRQLAGQSFVYLIHEYKRQLQQKYTRHTRRQDR